MSFYLFLAVVWAVLLPISCLISFLFWACIIGTIGWLVDLLK